MNIGLPGSGIGGVFYICLSIFMPVIHTGRAIKGKTKPHHLRMVLLSVCLSLSIVLVLYGEFWFLKWVSKRFIENSQISFLSDWFTTNNGKSMAASIAPILTIIPFAIILTIVLFLHLIRFILLTRNKHFKNIRSENTSTSVCRGFTLIEILVALSVIAILTGIIVPALNIAREHANKVTCSANLRQYGIATISYIYTNDGFFPNPHTWLFKNPSSPKMGPKHCQWHNKNLKPDGALWSKSTPLKIHMCPTFRRISRRAGQNHPFHDPKITIEPLYSYSMNAYLGMLLYNGVMKFAQIKRPADVFMFSEENMWPTEGVTNSVLNDTVLLTRYPPYSSSDISDTLGTFHLTRGSNLSSGKANLLYIDGHVDSYNAGRKDVDEIFALSWPK